MKALHQVGVGDVEATARIFYEFETRKQWADAKPDIKKTWLDAAQQFRDLTTPPQPSYSLTDASSAP